MSKKNIDTIESEERSDGSYVVKKSRRSNIFAFILCVLLAFFIWAYTQNAGVGDGESTETGDGQESSAALCGQTDMFAAEVL
ncbi:MAG: hypothetical protein IJY08_02050 [Clostridia bacterium]|nr:hypothetical protein [Clostridia bacterium]